MNRKHLIGVLLLFFLMAGCETQEIPSEQHVSVDVVMHDDAARAFEEIHINDTGQCDSSEQSEEITHEY